MKRSLMGWMAAGMLAAGLAGCGEGGGTGSAGGCGVSGAIEVTSCNQYAGATTEEAIKASENLMPKIREAAGLFCPNESSALGMLRALESEKMTGKVKYVGFDASEQLVKGLRDGEIEALIIQNPKKMGHDAVMTLVAQLQGKKVEPRVDTGVQVLTRENLDSPEIQKIISPPNIPAVPDLADPQFTIAVIPKGTLHVFWQTVLEGVRNAELELRAQGVKVKVIWKGPLKEDQKDDQIKVVDDFVSQKVSGIALAPLDDVALATPVRDATKAGIPVVIFDSSLNAKQAQAGKDYVSFVATDNYKGGVMAGQELAKLIGNKGKVVLMRYLMGSASTTEREAGFLKALNDVNAAAPK